MCVRVCLRAFNSYYQCVSAYIITYFVNFIYINFLFVRFHFNDQFAKQIECVACVWHDWLGYVCVCVRTVLYHMIYFFVVVSLRFFLIKLHESFGAIHTLIL